MDELKEVLTIKTNKAKELCKRLEELLAQNLEKLNSSEKEALPKFSWESGKSLDQYLDELIKAVKSPIMFRRKQALIELGIKGIEHVEGDIFDDNIEDTIQTLKDLLINDELFKEISKWISSVILKDSIIDINSRLNDIRNNIENLKKLDDIKSKSVRVHFLKKFINKEVSIYQIDEIKRKVINIEETLYLQITQDEIDSINNVCSLITETNEYGKNLEEKYISLDDAIKKLSSFRDELQQKYKQIKKEIDFWQQLFHGYVSETKNIGTLINNLNKLKEKGKGSYNSFPIMEQIFNQSLDKEIGDLSEFAPKLEKVTSYISGLIIQNKEDLNTVNNIYLSIEWLEKVQYENIKELCKKIKLENIEEFLNKIDQTKEEYGRLNEDSKAYQRILGSEDNLIDASYPLLKQKVDEYKNNLQHRIGEGFESLIRFLKEEKEDIDADKETIEKFIRIVRPFLREALGI